MRRAPMSKDACNKDHYQITKLSNYQIDQNDHSFLNKKGADFRQPPSLLVSLSLIVQ
jgi:hypothetical protein